jgi:hypothetical protein
MEKTMSKTTMHNSEASLEFRDLRDGLSDEELKTVSGGYIGETEKTPQKRSQDEGFKSSNDAPPLRRSRGGPFCDFQ